MEEQDKDAAEYIISVMLAHRINAAKKVIYEIFEPEVGGKIARLKGPGGATGVITIETLERAIEFAAMPDTMMNGGEVDEGQSNTNPPRKD